MATYAKTQDSLFTHVDTQWCRPRHMPRTPLCAPKGRCATLTELTRTAHSQTREYLNAQASSAR